VKQDGFGIAFKQGMRGMEDRPSFPKEEVLFVRVFVRADYSVRACVIGKFEAENLASGILKSSFVLQCTETGGKFF